MSDGFEIVPSVAKILLGFCLRGVDKSVKLHLPIVAVTESGGKDIGAS